MNQFISDGPINKKQRRLSVFTEHCRCPMRTDPLAAAVRTDLTHDGSSDTIRLRLLHHFITGFSLSSLYHFLDLEYDVEATKAALSVHVHVTVE